MLKVQFIHATLKPGKTGWGSPAGNTLSPCLSTLLQKPPIGQAVNLHCCNLSTKFSI